MLMANMDLLGMNRDGNWNTVDCVKSQESVVALMVPYSLSEEYMRVRMDIFTLERNA